jgi:hypothetical protein
VGELQSPSSLLSHLNVFTALSLFRVRVQGTHPDFRIPTSTVARMLVMPVGLKCFGCRSTAPSLPSTQQGSTSMLRIDSLGDQPSKSHVFDLEEM